MTIKDQANELVMKFIPHSKGDKEVKPINSAKMCAILAVQEKMKSLNAFAEYWNIKSGEWYLTEIAKLTDLQLEIEKL